jgi:hypothetical protein
MNFSILKTQERDIHVSDADRLGTLSTQQFGILGTGIEGKLLVADYLMVLYAPQNLIVVPL